jgi:hypothetical protein
MLKKLIIISSLLVTTTFAADKQEDEWKASGRLNAYIQSVDVDGGGASAGEREGTTHNEELNLNFRGPMGKGKAGIDTRMRTTNDDKIQAHGAEMLYMKAYYRDKIWTVEAGDVAASLNPYIFSGSMKGAKAVYKSAQKDHTWNYTIATGAKTASWRDLLEDGGDTNPTGYAGAFEAKYIYERSKEIALSVAALDTHFSSSDTNTSEAKNGYGLGIDGKWRFNKYITLKGRAAFTDGKKDKRVDSASSNGAVYVKLLTRPVLKSVKSNFVYQRVDADFVSFGGSANDDKEQIENSTSWTINKEFRARLDLKYNHNNLDGKATNGTENYYYEAVALTYKPSFLKRGDFNFRVSNKDVDDDVKDTNRITAGVDFNLRQKSGWRYGAGYDYSDQDDNNASSSRSHIVKALLGYKHKLGKESSYRFTARPNYQIIENSQDKIGFKLDAGYVYSKRLSAGLMYMINDTDYDSSSTSKNTQNATYQFRSTYKLDAKGKNLLRLLLEKRDVDVDETPDSTYNEYKGKVSLVMNF